MIERVSQKANGNTNTNCMINQKKYAIIVAGGSGTRMGADIPKQFLLLKEQPVLMYTIQNFFNYDSSIEIIVALPKEQFSYWSDLVLKHRFNVVHKVVAGGQSRFHSVKNALAEVDKEGLVAIHDGVRPLVTHETIERCFQMAGEKGNAIPVVDIVESIRELKGENSKAVDRSKYKAVQTPQVFKTNLIKEGYNQEFSPFFTDDASLVEAMGHTIFLTEGNRENIKITTKSDLVIAEFFLLHSL